MGCTITSRQGRYFVSFPDGTIKVLRPDICNGSISDIYNKIEDEDITLFEPNPFYDVLSSKIRNKTRSVVNINSIDMSSYEEGYNKFFTGGGYSHMEYSTSPSIDDISHLGEWAEGLCTLSGKSDYNIILSKQGHMGCGELMLAMLYDNISINPDHKADLIINQRTDVEVKCISVSDNIKTSTGRLTHKRALLDPGKLKPEDLLVIIVRSGMKPIGIIKIPGNICHDIIAGDRSFSIGEYDVIFIKNGSKDTFYIYVIRNQSASNIS